MKVIINPEYQFLNDYIRSLPDNFDSLGIPIYQARNVLKKDMVKGITLVIKKFKVPHLINRFSYTFLRSSKAARSYYNSLEIKKRGFNAPDPIAFIEINSCCFFSESYYVCLFEEEAQDLRNYMGNYRLEDNLFRKSFSDYTAKIHQAGIMHIDYSPGNILVKTQKDEFVFSLVDVNRMQFRNISMIDACKNLSRLCTSKDVFIDICKDYAFYRGFNGKEFLDLALYYRNCFFRNYTFRLSFKSWRRKQGSWYTKPVVKYRLYDKLSSCQLLSASTRAGYKQKRIEVYNTYLKEHDCGAVFEDFI